MPQYGITNILIIILGLLAAFYLYLVFLKPNRYRGRADSFDLNTISNLFPFKFLVDAILPKEDDREYIKVNKLIKVSNTKIDIRSVYLLKIIIPVLMFLFIFAIYQTNKGMVIKAIIDDSISKRVEVFADGGAKVDKQLEMQRARERESDRSAFSAIQKSFSSKFKSTDEKSLKQEIQEKLIAESAYQADQIVLKTNELYSRLAAVDKAKQTNYITIMIILFIALVGFIAPDTYLNIRAFLRKQAYDNEVISLEMLAILVGTVENVTVKELLKILRDNSKAYKPNLEKCLLEYPTDFEKALIDLSDGVSNKDFKSLAGTLRQCATSDKNQALNTLRRRRTSRKEYRKLTEEKKIEMKSFIGLALLAPSLFLLASILLAPWQDLLSFNIGI